MRTEEGRFGDIFFVLKRRCACSHVPVLLCVVLSTCDSWGHGSHLGTMADPSQPSQRVKVVKQQGVWEEPDSFVTMPRLTNPKAPSPLGFLAGQKFSPLHVCHFELGSLLLAAEILQGRGGESEEGGDGHSGRMLCPDALSFFTALESSVPNTAMIVGDLSPVSRTGS